VFYPHARCPLGHEWLIWGFTRVVHGDVTADVIERLARDQRVGLELTYVARTIPVDWTEDTSVPVRFIGHASRLQANAWHRCGDFTLNGQRVHIDLFGGNGGGPGFGFRDERIYIDDQLRGRGWQMGNSLGGGGMNHPAVALLRPDLGIRIVWREQIVQLVMREEPGVKKKAERKPPKMARSDSKR
jgi:hypothetical protein